MDVLKINGGGRGEIIMLCEKCEMWVGLSDDDEIFTACYLFKQGRWHIAIHLASWA